MPLPTACGGIADPALPQQDHGPRGQQPLVGAHVVCGALWSRHAEQVVGHGRQQLAGIAAGRRRPKLEVGLGEVDEARIDRRVKQGFCDVKVNDLDDAMKLIDKHTKNKKPISIGLVGNAATVFAQLHRMGVYPDMITDQTSAHDELNGYIPEGLSPAEAAALRKRNPGDYIKRSYKAMMKHCEAMVRWHEDGAVVFDYGNNLRGQAEKGGLDKIGRAHV
mgnify:CR=1 FL=1